jgi:hypothetical protein
VVCIKKLILLEKKIRTKFTIFPNAKRRKKKRRVEEVVFSITAQP